MDEDEAYDYYWRRSPKSMDINRDTDPAPNGQFSFTGLMTSQLTRRQMLRSSPQPAPRHGSPILQRRASETISLTFFWAFPANTKVQFGDTSTYFRNWGFVGYATDDWHMFPRFTLTYGVRYEAFTPPTEINGHIANLNVNSDFTASAMRHSGMKPQRTNCVRGTSAGPCFMATTTTGHPAWASPGSRPENGFPANIS